MKSAVWQTSRWDWESWKEMAGEGRMPWNWKIALGWEARFDLATDSLDEGGEPAHPPCLFSPSAEWYAFAASRLIQWKEVEGHLFITVDFALYTRLAVLQEKGAMYLKVGLRDFRWNIEENEQCIQRGMNLWKKGLANSLAFQLNLLGHSWR